MVAEKCFCYVRTDPRRAEAQGHQRADHRHGHAGHRRAAAAPHHRRGRLRRGVLHRRRGAGREPRRRRRTTAGASRWARSPTSAAGCGCEGVATARRWPSTTSCALARRRRPARRRRRAPPARRGLRARSRRCGRSATRASPSFAQGGSAPEHSYLKLATSELGKALFELGMELQGPCGAVVDPERGEESGRWAHSLFVSFAIDDRRRHERDPAQHHRHPRPRAPAGLGRMDFTLTDEQQLLVDTARVAARPRLPAVARARRRRGRPRRRPRSTALADLVALGDGPVVDHVLVAERRARPARRALVRHLGAGAAAAARRRPPARRRRRRRRAAADRGVGRRRRRVADPAERRRRCARSSSTLDLVDDVVVVAPGGLGVVGRRRRAGRIDVARPRPAPRGRSSSTVRRSRTRSTTRRSAGARPRHRRARRRAVRHGPAACSTWPSRTPKERVQFDVPIGSFQAVQHLLADLALDVERAWAARAVGGDVPRRRRRRCRRRRGRRTSPRPPPREAGAARRAGRRSRSTAASATRGSTTCTCGCAGPPPPRTCSAPPASTTTRSPHSSYP